MKWLIVAGGTGGHIFPGIAVAEELIRRGRTVYFVSGIRKIEKTILEDRPFNVYHLDMEGFIGRSFLEKVKATYKMIKAFLICFKLVSQLKPDIVFATGGYISFPVVVAAKFFRKKTGLHEQNIEPGIANKVLSKMVDVVFISIKGVEKHFPKRTKIVFSGNPVRKDILEKRPREHKGKGLLILGGSLGARFINDLSLKVVPELLKKFPEVYVYHQTGLDEFERIKEKYQQVLNSDMKSRVKVYPFIKDMGWIYSQVDLFLGRAGATTLAELFAVGLPAVFIPFPYATRDHQKKNALAVAEKGGAIVVDQKEATPEKVLTILTELLNNQEKLTKMSEVMKSLFVKDSENIIIQTLEGLVKYV